MLGVFPNNTPDVINESLGFAQALTKESLESLPANKDISLVFYLILVLLPAEQGSIFQEGSRKRNLIWACDTCGDKVIFALLETIVTLQISFTLINVRKLNFQRPLTWAFIMRSAGNNKSQKRYRSWKK